MDYFGLLRVACSQFVGPFVAMSSLIARIQLFAIIDGKAIGLGEFERRDFQVAKGKEISRCNGRGDQAIWIIGKE